MLLRDVAQFAGMLALVRLLTPEDYGSAAMAQSIIGLLSVASFGTFIAHSLQIRNPKDVDWQAHFTVAVVLNSVLFALSIAIAGVLLISNRYHSVAAPLAVAASVFIVEIAATSQNRMLETEHDWKRYRLLAVAGTVLSVSVGVAIALLGGGVWALAVQPPLFGLPAAIDLFLNRDWRPNFGWSWPRYRDSAHFGFNRMLSAAILRGRVTVEQAVLAGLYDFGTLGVFTRATGLANLVAGRIGTVAMMSLYPIITRAEERSAQFQRIAALVLRGVCWTTLPVAVFVALSAREVVSIVYGAKWLDVVSLLPLALIGVGLAGLTNAVSTLLLANNALKTTLVVDSIASSIAIGISVWCIPMGVRFYLAALALHGFAAFTLTSVALAARRGITARALAVAVFPAVVATGVAVALVAALRFEWPAGWILAARLLLEGMVYGFSYVATLRCVFPRATSELLDVVPGGRMVARALLFRKTSNNAPTDHSRGNEKFKSSPKEG